MVTAAVAPTTTSADAATSAATAATAATDATAAADATAVTAAANGVDIALGVVHQDKDMFGGVRVGMGSVVGLLGRMGVGEYEG